MSKEATVTQFFKIRFFSKGSGLCGSDFERHESNELVNINQISSISDIVNFNLPFSGSYVGRYAKLKI